MHDAHRVGHLLRKHLIQIGEEAGDGSWEQQEEIMPTPDGKATLVISVRPLRPGGQSSPGGGRPAEVAKEVVKFLRGHPDSHRTDIIEALEALGFSATAVGDNLRILRVAGVIEQAARGGPYRLMALDD